MGPVVPMPGEPPGTQLRQHQDTTTNLPSTEKPEKKIKKLVIAAFEFHRVETPFLIGLWIFFASIAKIGEFTYISVIIYFCVQDLVQTWSI